MNIEKAKEQISHAITAYTARDENGSLLIPLEKQRPVFLYGPPGTGKTAIMEQIAAEHKIALLSYSMTHHTRQSALGLPFIVHKKYDNEEYDVSEYTMSEIISSVYELMEKTGMKQGILFLDEINCVSETLSPIMLQFLQYKVFGRHRVPDGWIVVTAGNPPEYNKSVRDFDLATWDRVKRIDVEPEFEVWRNYGASVGVHQAIMTYLEVKRENFYHIESTVDGKRFVTARGWENLSMMICVCEKCGIPVDNELISQYIQDKRIARDFAGYYELYNTYRSDYHIDEILEGTVTDDIVKRLTSAGFDEKIAVVGLMLEGVNNRISPVINKVRLLDELRSCIRRFKMTGGRGTEPAAMIRKLAEEQRAKAERGRSSSGMTVTEQTKLRISAEYLEQYSVSLNNIEEHNKAFELIKAELDKENKAVSKQAEAAGKALSNMFVFSEKALKDGHELLMIVTELTINSAAAEFISKYGCKEYFEHSKAMKFSQRSKALSEQLAAIKTEDTE